MAPYTSPTKLSSSILCHFGSLRVNQADGGVTPVEYQYTTDSVSVPVADVGQDFNSPAFTHFDAGVVQGANYDELVIDPLPTITYSLVTQLASVSTTNCATAYSQIAAANKPFWLIVHLDGYGIPNLYATATAAINLAYQIQTLLYSDMLNALMTPNFRGFAFIAPDLNRVYPDGSSITRQQQNALVQSCWTLGVSCCFVTARPLDALTLVAPILTANKNSGVFMPNPIIGCNIALPADKIVILYPNVQVSGQNLSVVVGQAAATLGQYNRDPGFSPNLKFAYAVPIQDSFWTADGTGGVTGVTGVEANLKNIANFCAAMGITQFGVYGISSTQGNDVPSPTIFLPADSAVNTTGNFSEWGADGSAYVAYSNGQTPPGTIVRQFQSNFVEVQYSGSAFP